MDAEQVDRIHRWRMTAGVSASIHDHQAVFGPEVIPALAKLIEENERLRREVESRTRKTSRLGAQASKLQSLLHQSEVRYGKLLKVNEDLVAENERLRGENERRFPAASPPGYPRPFDPPGPEDATKAVVPVEEWERVRADVEDPPPPSPKLKGLVEPVDLEWDGEEAEYPAYVPRERLERAEAEVKQLREWKEADADLIQAYSAGMVKTEAERDELRAEVKRLREENERLRTTDIAAVVNYHRRAESDLREAEAEVERLREELRLATLAANAEAQLYNEENAARLKLRAERDEAVAALEAIASGEEDTPRARAAEALSRIQATEGGK